ncbi:AAA family ATPase [Ferrimonas sp. SCSIO 43195]|uniref:AAA family ATPase n=1 Tax=Ferrimonas sp. SCSIO 43195 TaxID=2822844 RepID=UPI0020753381|nr:AAA family ATPase [Ferrimonas sp. SCSIO 43195]USD37893.1 AAA family ATPase [Ferrimonas sp. SCSIO 43195]
MAESTLPFSLLPSQHVLLERLKYLIEYGDHAILLHGRPGVGKSVVSRALLDKAEGFNQGLIQCQPQPDPAQLRVDILQQLFTNPLFDPHEPLVDSFERILADSQQRLFVVIDDAHYLPQVILAELLAILLGQEQRHWRMTLVLVSQPVLVEHLLAELPSECQQHLLPVTIEPLSLAEQKQLYHQLTGDRPLARFISQMSIDAQLQQSDGSAAAVVALAEGLSTGKAIPVSALRHRNWIMAIATVILMLMLWVWVSPTRPAEIEPEHGGRSASVKLVEVAPGLQENHASAAEAVEGKDVPGNAEAASEVAESAQLGLAGEWQAINQPAAPLPQRKRKQAEAADPLLESARAGLQELEQELSRPKPKVESQPKPKPAPTATAKPVLPLPQQPLMERPASGYTLQLAVYSYPQLAQRYLRRLPSTDGLAVYKKRRDPQPWFVVVYGGYVDKAAAQAAVATLPQSIQDSKPYVKPVRDVQRELLEQLDLAAFLSE